jgi:hypothetical protein
VIIASLTALVASPAVGGNARRADEQQVAALQFRDRLPSRYRPHQPHRHIRQQLREFL